MCLLVPRKLQERAESINTEFSGCSIWNEQGVRLRHSPTGERMGDYRH